MGSVHGLERPRAAVLHRAAGVHCSTLVAELGRVSSSVRVHHAHIALEPSADPTFGWDHALSRMYLAAHNIYSRL